MPQKEQFISKGIKWIDVTDPSESEVAELSKIYNLNPHTVQDSLQPEHLPKYEIVDNIQFMILRYFAGIDSCLTTIQELTNKVAVFYTENLLITIHRFEIPFIELIYNRYQNQNKNFFCYGSHL